MPAIADAIRQRSEEESAGFTALALGKHGAGELNYSSDIDPILLYDPDLLPRRPRDEPGEAAQRVARSVVETLSRQDHEGYVFRVDLRLRPASEVSPLAISFDAALSHYESSALAWERAAFIRARAAAGDVAAGEDFLRTIRPFVWRKNLDFGAIEEIRRLTARIRSHHGGPDGPGRGFDLKRGRGGVREVEFFAQTHQLIHGGRRPSLRVRGTRARSTRWRSLPSSKSSRQEAAGENERPHVGSDRCSCRLHVRQPGERDARHQRHVRHFSRAGHASPGMVPHRVLGRAAHHGDRRRGRIPRRRILRRPLWRAPGRADRQRVIRRAAWPALPCRAVSPHGSMRFTRCMGLAATFSSCVLLMKPVSLWFTRHRGLLFAITGAFGINIGIAVIPFLVTHLMTDHGWRAAYVGLGAFTLLVGFPSMMLLKNPPAGAIGAAAPECRCPA